MGTVMNLLEHLGEKILGYRENYRDGLYLCDHREHCAATGLHEIPGIHEAQADTPGERRDDMTVGKLNLFEIKRSLIGPYKPLVLSNDLYLIIELLPCNGVAAPGLLESIQVHFGLRQYISVAFERSLC